MSKRDEKDEVLARIAWLSAKLGGFLETKQRESRVVLLEEEAVEKMIALLQEINRLAGLKKWEE